LTLDRGRADDGVVRPRSRARRLLAAVAGLVAALALALAVAVPAGAQQGGDTPPTSEETPVPAPRIIPLPNTGTKPTDAGDRGGALQILVFVALVVGVSSIAALAVHDARRSRRRAAEAEAAAEDEAEPQSSGP
jgi:hypothetical protein